MNKPISGLTFPEKWMIKHKQKTFASPFKNSAVKKDTIAGVFCEFWKKISDCYSVSIHHDQPKLCNLPNHFDFAWLFVLHYSLSLSVYSDPSS